MSSSNQSDHSSQIPLLPISQNHHQNNSIAGTAVAVVPPTSLALNNFTKNSKYSSKNSNENTKNGSSFNLINEMNNSLNLNNNIQTDLLLNFGQSNASKVLSHAIPFRLV
jgi:hypothetical protein